MFCSHDCKYYILIIILIFFFSEGAFYFSNVENGNSCLMIHPEFQEKIRQIFSSTQKNDL